VMMGGAAAKAVFFLFCGVPPGSGARITSWRHGANKPRDSAASLAAKPYTARNNN